MTQVRCYLYRWLLLAAASCISQLAHAQTPPAPPRTIHDITALLDQYKPDPAKVELLKARVVREPPPNAKPDELLAFLLDRAEAAGELGMATKQVADLRRAAELARGTDEEWQILMSLWIVEVFAGNLVNAIKLKERMPRAVGSKRGRLIAEYSTAAALYAAMGDLPAARAALRNAQAAMFEMERAHAWVTWGDSWISSFEGARGRVLNAEGKYAAAEAAYRNALAAQERFLEIAPQVIGAEGIPRERVEFIRDVQETRLAQNLRLQGRLAEAELGMRNVLQRLLGRIGRYAPATAFAVGEFALTLFEQGRFREAEAMARAAIDIHRNIGSVPEGLVYVGARRALGTALVAQSRWNEALKVYEEMRADLAKDPQALGRLGQGDIDWALALIKSGRPTEAISMLEAALERLAKQVGAEHRQLAMHRGMLGMALAESGRSVRALVEFQEAMKVLLARGRVDTEEEAASPAQLWRLTLILEGYIKLLYDIRNEPRQPGFEPASEAFRVADAARGQSTQRALAASAARAATTDPALAEVVRREQDAKQQLAVLYSTLLRLLGAPPDQQLPQVVAQIRARIKELENEHRQLFAELEKRFPAYVDLINPRPATVAEARGTLREGEALVSVLVTDDLTYVWVVPKSGPVAFHAANLGGKEVGRIVARLRRALDPGTVPLERFPEFDVAAAHRLYAELLKPVAAAWKGAHTLLVVTNGALMQLPLSVLPTEPVALPADSGLKFERYKTAPWLIKQVAVVQLPAVNTLITLRTLPAGNAGRRPFVGFGDPQFGREAPAAEAPVALRMRNLEVPRLEGEKKAADWIPYGQLAPLPDTREEILAMAAALKADPEKDIFLGTQASKENVRKADLRTRRIVAFATHGLIPGDFPNLEQPALALSAPDGNAETGLFTLEDILGLKMDADWVVLSACNTAAGEGQGAEAISGLGRGFFYAGSRALLVTHWPVETRSA
ncbi:MAG TPA: CHAT domain-containing tetratricopeptide repeat protein, partial [Burkholderiales bacterium]|nr:CHAT domain-containing tetratricopeptide repeat protein [Burkholderiales bacterium]